MGLPWWIYNEEGRRKHNNAYDPLLGNTRTAPDEHGKKSYVVIAEENGVPVLLEKSTGRVIRNLSDSWEKSGHIARYREEKARREKERLLREGEFWKREVSAQEIGRASCRERV